MRKFLRDHGLSLSLSVVYVFLEGLAIFLPEGKAQTIIAGHADGVFAIILAVVFKRFFYEKGSPEADDPPEDQDEKMCK